jgi:hypothetical protein
VHLHRARLSGFFTRAGSLGFFAGIAGPLFVVYLITASWGDTGSIDTFTNVLTARAIATEGTVYVDDHEVLATEGFRGRSAWLVDVDGRTVSQYPPGAALHAVPFYALWPGTPEVVQARPLVDPTADLVTIAMPPVHAAAIASALVTALAIGFVGLTFRELLGEEPALAAGGAFVAGLATSAWSVAADELWQHGPAMLWLAVAGYALARGSGVGAGVGYAIAVAVRPLTVIIGGVAALGEAWRRRWWSAVAILAGAALGLASVVAYNNAVFGGLSISGGYGSKRTDSLRDPDLVEFVLNVGRGLVAPRYGLLVWSSFLVVLALGLRDAWRKVPAWVHGPALGGALYLLTHWLLNRASGGTGYLFYRYPLEPLVAAAPLLFASYAYWVRPRPSLARACHLLIVLSIAGHGMAAVT